MKRIIPILPVSTVGQVARLAADDVLFSNQSLVNGTKYPAVLLPTGVNDPRVDPANSRKMTARLQAATGSQEPVLLRVTQAGHGIGSSLDEQIAEQSDVFAFLFDQLGMK